MRSARLGLEVESFALGAVTHPMVRENQGRHCFDNGYRARHNTGVVPPSTHEFGLLAFAVNGGLFLD